MKLIVMGGSGREPVTADDLRMVVIYCNQLRQIEDMLAAHAESIITRLTNGANSRSAVTTPMCESSAPGASSIKC